MKVSVLQYDIAWQASQQNKDIIESQIDNLSTDILVLPEMFNTGFSMDSPKVAEAVDGQTLQWMKTIAQDKQFAVCGSVATKVEQGYVNRFWFVKPNGEAQFYDKRHLFRMGKEHESYLPGNERVIIDYMGFRILLQICYDLRFPVFSRNQNDYDMIIYVANWPAVRDAHWSSLLTARAIENQAYVVGSNRIGDDANGTAHCGSSVILSPVGEVIADLAKNQTGIIDGECDLSELQQLRKKFPVSLDADEFQLS